MFFPSFAASHISFDAPCWAALFTLSRSLTVFIVSSNDDLNIQRKNIFLL